MSKQPKKVEIVIKRACRINNGEGSQRAEIGDKVSLLVNDANYMIGMGKALAVNDANKEAIAKLQAQGKKAKSEK